MDRFQDGNGALARRRLQQASQHLAMLQRRHHGQDAGHVGVERVLLLQQPPHVRHQQWQLLQQLLIAWRGCISRQQGALGGGRCGRVLSEASAWYLR
jgi:hypothetical protein